MVALVARSRGRLSGTLLIPIRKGARRVALWIAISNVVANPPTLLPASETLVSHAPLARCDPTLGT